MESKRKPHLVAPSVKLPAIFFVVTFLFVALGTTLVLNTRLSQQRITTQTSAAVDPARGSCESFKCEGKEPLFSRYDCNNPTYCQKSGIVDIRCIARSEYRLDPADSTVAYFNCGSSKQPPGEPKVEGDIIRYDNKCYSSCKKMYGGDKKKCNADSRCEFDDGGTRTSVCESKENLKVCEDIGNQEAQCNRNPLCNYEEDILTRNKCETIGFEDPCPGEPGPGGGNTCGVKNEQQCEDDKNCRWTGGPATSALCEDGCALKNKDRCDADTKCHWTGGPATSALCADGPPPSACGKIGLSCCTPPPLQLGQTPPPRCTEGVCQDGKCISEADACGKLGQSCCTPPPFQLGQTPPPRCTEGVCQDGKCIGETEETGPPKPVQDATCTETGGECRAHCDYKGCVSGLCGSTEDALTRCYKKPTDPKKVCERENLTSYCGCQNTILEPGDEGEAPHALQHKLTDKQCLVDDPKYRGGVFDEPTEQAVINFQKANSVNDPNGKVTEETWRALCSDAGKTCTNQSSDIKRDPPPEGTGCFDKGIGKTCVPALKSKCEEIDPSFKEPDTKLSCKGSEAEKNLPPGTELKCCIIDTSKIKKPSAANVFSSLITWLFEPLSQ